MNLKKFFGSKKIFILSLLPSILIHIFDYSEYLSRKGKTQDGCDWAPGGQGCKNYFDYIGKSIGGWDFAIMGDILFIVASLLLLGAVYFLIHKNNKISLFSFILLLSVIVWFLIITGRL
jgi:hypothetical protein